MTGRATPGLKPTFSASTYISRAGSDVRSTP